MTGTGNAWTYTFTDLPRYDAGEEIVYTVTENGVPGYTAAINGYSITNTHTPATVDVTGNKVWLDNEDQDGLRPAAVTIRLLANGTEVSAQAVTGTGNTWGFAFTGLPRYQNGAEIAYTVTEDTAEGYTASVVGTTVYNTHIPAEPEQFTLTVRYWVGGQTAFPTFFRVYAYGDAYNVVSPLMPGYSVDLPVVSGIIYEDTVVDVYYTPDDVTLTVYYQYLNGE